MDSNIKNDDTQTVKKTVKKNLYEIIIEDIKEQLPIWKPRYSLSQERHRKLCCQRLCYSVIWALRELNIKVPEDMSICGFDNTIWSQKTEMGITTISQDFTEIGKQVSSILLSSLKDPAYPNRKCIVPVKLIVRGSTLPPGYMTCKMGSCVHRHG